MPQDTPFFSPEDSLVAIMMAMSASDETIETAELLAIEEQINHLPVFADYDPSRIRMVANAVLDLFAEEDGLDRLFGHVRASLPPHLNETAYALACEVAAADGSLGDVELALLAEIRHELNVERLHAAAIERGARARHMRL